MSYPKSNSTDATERRLSAWALPIALVVVSGLIAWSIFEGGIVADLLGSSLDATEKIERLRQFFEQCRPWAPVVYVAFVTVEVVVAPIPGLMLYAPGGAIFGGFFGGLFALVGNVIGAGIACSISRRFGPGVLTRFFEQSSLDAAQAAIEKRGSLLIFLLRLNPLTSSDIVSYAAGFTTIPVWKVMLATMIGMAPLCFAQAWLAESVFTVMPELIYPMIAACLIYIAFVWRVVRRMSMELPAAEVVPVDRSEE